MGALILQGSTTEHVHAPHNPPSIFGGPAVSAQRPSQASLKAEKSSHVASQLVLGDHTQPEEDGSSDDGYMAYGGTPDDCYPPAKRRKHDSLVGASHPTCASASARQIPAGERQVATSSRPNLETCIATWTYGKSPTHCARRYLRENPQVLNQPLYEWTTEHLAEVTSLQPTMANGYVQLSTFTTSRIWTLEARAYLIFVRLR